MSEEPLIAVFVDFENLAIGVRDAKYQAFQIQLVLKRLLEKGRVVYKRAYCDWSNYRDAIREFHAQGIELIDIPQSKASGKNSADIHMVVDALDLCYAKDHIDIFALLSGDSDFSPLVSKLKENDKRVIGCGVKSSTSNLLIAACDEFIYYDDLARGAEGRRRDRRQEGEERAHRQEAGGHRPAVEDRAVAGDSITSRCGDRWSSRRSAASIPTSTRSTTAIAISPTSWRRPRAAACSNWSTTRPGAITRSA